MKQIKDKKKFNEFMVKLGINPENWQEELRKQLAKRKPSINLNKIWKND